MPSSINASTTAGLVNTADTSGVLQLQTAGTTAISIDASQAVSFTNSPTVTGGTANGVAYLNGSKVLTTGSALVFDGTNLGVGVTPVSSVYTPSRNLFVGQGTVLTGRTTINFTSLNTNSYEYPTTSAATFINASSAASQYYQYLGEHRWQSSTNTPTANTSIVWNTAMTLDSSGNLLVGATNASQGGILRVVSASAEAGTIATFGYTANGSSVYILDARATGQNNSGTAMLVLKNTSTSRSISAAGTINASGADYAEYMTKAGNFTIAKGDVVGIDAQGNLTNVFDNAVSFMVKSTDPSYVGGDSWGSEEAIGLSMPKKPSQRQATEEVEAETDEEFAVRFAQYEADQSAFDAALEAARQRVDRIAFSGQVPVNVTGATAGQYIIPVNDNGAIKGEAINEADMTLSQYMKAVGKVIAIESDGRAKIIVKVA